MIEIGLVTGSTSLFARSAIVVIPSVVLSVYEARALWLNRGIFCIFALSDRLVT